VLKTLEGLGIMQPDAHVYILLGKKGPHKAVDIAKSLRLSKQTAYRAIKNLQSKGLITATIEHPARFSSVPFEKVLDMFVKEKMEEVHRIKQDKKTLLNDWESIAISGAGDRSPRFAVIEGRRYIYPRLKQMIEDAKSEISIISTIQGLLRADQFGLFDAAFEHSSKTNTKVRFITELSNENCPAIKKLLKETKRKSVFEGRTPELGLGSISRMIIRDSGEVVFFVNQESEKSGFSEEDLCFWTNSSAIVNSFKAVFESLWQNSTDIQKKIGEIENGKSSSKTTVFKSAEIASQKYIEAIRSAKKEITILTSSQGIIDIAKQKQLLTLWDRKNFSVKIMAPITNDNLSSAQQLSKEYQIKHVPVGYLETTLVDNCELFQFKSSPFKKSRQGLLCLENTFYSNDFEYVDKTKKLLDDLWQSAQSPLAMASNLSNELNNPNEIHKNSPTSKKIGVRVIDIRRLTEKEILNRVIHEKKVHVIGYPADADTVYATAGSAVINLPSEFKLPHFMIETLHIEDISSHGIGEVLTIYQWLNQEKACGYAPVAVLMTNSEAYLPMKVLHANDLAAGNVHLVRADELQSRTHGNTMFTGWTVPLPLYPREYVLPPACLTIEGYGQVNSMGFALVSESGPKSIKSEIETNYFNAFVTFNHPNSKYSGPGTDGFFCREYILKIHPPKPIQ
jgi:HTH-type transcriptional regulator, sugar sensing transcriptional regulator